MLNCHRRVIYVYYPSQYVLSNKLVTTDLSSDYIYFGLQQRLSLFVVH